MLPDMNDQRLRIIQELVPGRQVTLAHIIASPDAVVYKKLGLETKEDLRMASIGIMSISPAEIAVIAGDLALKASNVELGIIDRVSGTLVFTGTISNVASAIDEICGYLRNTLDFTVCEVTKT